MPEQDRSAIVTAEGAIDQLTAVRTAFALASLRLYQDPFVPTPASILAAFTAAVATFTGYAPVALSWSAVAVDSDLRTVIVSTRAFFQATDAVTPNTINGAWVQLAMGTVSEFYVPFDPPISMAAALNFIAITLNFYSDGTVTAEVES